MLQQARSMYYPQDRREAILSKQYQRINYLNQRGGKVQWFSGQCHHIKVKWNAKWYDLEQLVAWGVYPELDVSKPVEDFV